jgi:hypothetical protein
MKPDNAMKVLPEKKREKPYPRGAGIAIKV